METRQDEDLHGNAVPEAGPFETVHPEPEEIGLGKALEKLADILTDVQWQNKSSEIPTPLLPEFQVLTELARLRQTIAEIKSPTNDGRESWRTCPPT